MNRRCMHLAGKISSLCSYLQFQGAKFLEPSPSIPVSINSYPIVINIFKKSGPMILEDVMPDRILLLSLRKVEVHELI